MITSFSIRAGRSSQACLLLIVLVLSLMASACTTAEPPAFTAPADRAASDPSHAWPRNHYLALAYHDVEDDNPDQTFVSVSTAHLQQQLAWLREHGYQPISVDQILSAARGGPDLPERAVLLSFDDGYRSFYERVYPLLRAYNWPAVLAPVGVWVDPEPGAQVDFGGLPVPRERFLTWTQISEMSASGLVEIAAHTDNLHYGILANPQGNQQPAAAARLYDAQMGEYENDTQYRQRITTDVQAISQKIKRATGKDPRVWVWPYGTGSGLAAQAIQAQGYSLLLTLDDGLASLQQMGWAPRLLVANDPMLTGFANAVVAQERPDVMRAIHVAIDDIDDPDPAKIDEKLGKLVQRIADLQITTVFLNGAHQAGGDGQPVTEVYFPNRHLPMRADLFNRVAWQLRSRAFVDVYAYLPLNALPLVGATPQFKADLYEDLARYAIFAGILLDGPQAQDEIVQRVKAQRGGDTKVAHWLHTAANETPEASRTRLNTALDAADWVLLSPIMPTASQGLDDMAALVQSTQAPQRLVITLDADDYLARAKGVPNAQTAMASDRGQADQAFADQLRHLQTRGIRSYAYVSDDFNHDTPRLQIIRPVVSNAWYPFK